MHIMECLAVFFWLLPRNASNIHPHQVVTIENVSGRYQMSLGWQKSHLTERHHSA